MPVGLVNDLSPLGHSGHLKLQEVVGSTDKLMGKPIWKSRPEILDA